MPVLIDLTTAKAHLDITLSKDDDELVSFIDRAEAAIVKKIGPLAPTTVVSSVAGRAGAMGYPDAWDGRSIVLPTRPVISLTSVVGSSGATVDTSLLRVTDEGVVYYLDGWTRFNEIWYTVTYQAGRTDPPPDLELAVLELLRHFWDTQRGVANRVLIDRISRGEMQQTVGPVPYSFPNRVLELLTPYEHPEL